MCEITAAWTPQHVFTWVAIATDHRAEIGDIIKKLFTCTLNHDMIVSQILEQVHFYSQLRDKRVLCICHENHYKHKLKVESFPALSVGFLQNLVHEIYMHQYKVIWEKDMLKATAIKQFLPNRLIRTCPETWLCHNSVQTHTHCLHTTRPTPTESRKGSSWNAVHHRNLKVRCTCPANSLDKPS